MSSALKMLIQYLADGRIPQRVAKASIAKGFQHGRKNSPAYEEKNITSINQLSAALGYRNHSSMYPQKGRFAPETELLIRKLYEIGESTACWKRFCECDVPGFIDGYERIHKDEVAVAPTVSAGDFEKASPKPSNILLAKGTPKAPEPCKIRGLASVELFPAQVGRGSADIGFDISCGVVRICGVPVTIRIGEMIWDCGGGQLDPETRKGRGVPYAANNGVKLSWNGADTFRPAWRVEADSVSIGDLAVPPDFATVIGLTPGCAITATFGVWRPNIEDAEVADRNAVSAAFDAVTLPLDVDPATMSLVKKRIIARLAADAIESGADFIVLSRHTITFVAGPTE